MNNTIMLLRGINVGGHNKLRMQDLRSLLENLGLENVRTYIQSGNVVFQADSRSKEQLTQEISAAIQTQHGLSPRILLLNEEEFVAAVEGNPFPEGESEPKKLHFFFLAEPAANPDIEKMEALKKESEQYQLDEQVFYFYAPEGIGRSNLAAAAEKLLGVPTTARNWRTVTKIKELLGRG